MRLAPVALLCASAWLAGCATNLAPVREFATQTRQLGAAFEPVLDGTVSACETRWRLRRLYTTEQPLAQFDAAALAEAARQSCAPLAQAHERLRPLAQALSAWAERLAMLAGDDVRHAADSGYEQFATRAASFDGVDADQAGAVGALMAFLSRALRAGPQRDAVAQALDHEAAVGALADVLLAHAERVHGAYLREQLADLPLYEAQLREQTAAPLLARLQLQALHEQALALRERAATLGQLRETVAQMKRSLADLRTHLDQLDGEARRTQARDLAREVWRLTRQVNKAF